MAASSCCGGGVSGEGREGEEQQHGAGAGGVQPPT